VSYISAHEYSADSYCVQKLLISCSQKSLYVPDNFSLANHNSILRTFTPFCVHINDHGDVQMTRFRFEKGPPVNFMLQSGGRVWAAVSQIDHERQHKSRYYLCIHVVARHFSAKFDTIVF
jgi:hypothetical protein